MNKCRRCNVNIVDDSLMCPLCKGVLEIAASNIRNEKLESNTDEDDEIDLDTDVNTYNSRSIMYPDVEPAMKKIKFVIKLFIFISIIVECVLILINYLTYHGFKWSAICGAAMIYMCLTVSYSFQHNSGHRSKMLFQAIGAMALAVLIDYIIGYHGWSLNYAIPSGIILLDIAILVLMMVNFDHWQNYIMLQIVMFVFSAIFMVLVFLDIISFPLLTIIAVAVSGIILIGTLMFGEKKAINELFRRFRV